MLGVRGEYPQTNLHQNLGSTLYSPNPREFPYQNLGSTRSPQQDPAGTQKLCEVNSAFSGRALECSQIDFRAQGRLWYSRSPEQPFLLKYGAVIAIPREIPQVSSDQYHLCTVRIQITKPRAIAPSTFPNIMSIPLCCIEVTELYLHTNRFVKLSTILGKIVNNSLLNI